MNKKKTLILFLILTFLAFSQKILAQNHKAEGYKGLWSSSLLYPEFGYKYSGGLATYSPQHNPVAVYSPEAGKTFFVYGGTSDKNVSHLQIMISYFDHKTFMVPKPVIVMDKEGVNDARDNATISIDSEGYIFVFISGMGRTRPGYILRSTIPYSIDKFELIKEREMVFPQPWWINDSCFILMHSRFTRGRELLYTVSKDGNYWSPSVKLAGMGGHSMVTEAKGASVVSVFNYFPGGVLDRQTNLYVVKSNDVGKSWQTIDNADIQLPLTDKHNTALIKDFEAENKLVYLKDVTIDENGNPVILILTSNDFKPGPSGDPREWIIVHRKSERWVFTKVCESYNNYDMGSVYIKNHEWKVVGPTEPGSKKYSLGGEMALWVSNNEGYTWNKSFNITNSGEYNNASARRPVNANKAFYSFWSDGDPDKLSECRMYFTDESCKKVWVLPYDMKNNFEKPKRVKK